MDLGVVVGIFSVLKVVLGVLVIFFISIFYARWRKTGAQSDSNLVSFYAKMKFAKHYTVLGVGIFAIVLAFLVEYFLEVGVFVCPLSSVDVCAPRIAMHALEVVALVCMGYSAYKLARLEVPG